MPTAIKARLNPALAATRAAEAGRERRWWREITDSVSARLPILTFGVLVVSGGVAR